MRYATLAMDYDGTIAHDGVVDAPTLAALRRAKAGGLRLFLVTGRDVPALYDTFDHVALFDVVVAENGAVLYAPPTGAARRLAAPPPPPLLAELVRQDVPVSVGQSVVATYEPYGPALAEAIRRLDLPWHVVRNKSAVMALPIGIDKATGLMAALDELGLPIDGVVAVGDAENDVPMLAASGLGVAVANALPAVKAAAGWVTAGERGAGVAELIDHLLGPSWAPPQPVAAEAGPGDLACPRHV